MLVEGRLAAVDKTKRLRPPAGAFSQYSEREAYLSWLEIELKVEFSLLPRPFTTAIMATEMPAAMRPYSMAVAPDSSFMKLETRVFISWLLRSTRGCLSSTQSPFCRIVWISPKPIHENLRCG